VIFLSHNIPKQNKLAEKISQKNPDVRQPRHPFKMAAVTKAQILTAATWQ
jgi:hypothetical protein